MKVSALLAISPVDGRYVAQTRPLAPYFSEYALMRYRVLVEVEYFISLCKAGLPQLQVAADLFPKLRLIYKTFSIQDCKAIKDTEKTTNHDVKAVEYFLKDRLKALGLEKQAEFVHFGLTSQDINNTAIPLLLKLATHKVLLPELEGLLSDINRLANDYAHIAMPAHTHGQPASPTRLGKELKVFAERLERQLLTLRKVPYAAKFGGATGNFNAHHVAYPNIDWPAFADNFVEKRLRLKRSQTTTQIEHYDSLAEYCDATRRINIILIDLCRDIWQYISLGYFRQQIKEGEIGSSAMPHKINPIEFENAEGNLGLANALLGHFSEKLPISRLQRDLTDSTVLRNLGVPLAHGYISLRSIRKGLGKLQADENRIAESLAGNVAVIAEAIQTILRREGYPQPYEALKALTRVHHSVTLADMHRFIDGLAVTETIKNELKAITPENYTGV